MKLQNSFRDYTAESALFVRRALVAFLGILLLTGVLIANLYNLQIVRFTDYQTRSNENRIKLVPIAPSRGIIYDRNGIPLALNRTIYQIEMMPGVIFARTKHIGVIPLPFVADELLQLLEGETSDVGKLALPFTFQKRKFPRQRAGQRRFPASIRTDKRPTITRV